VGRFRPDLLLEFAVADDEAKKKSAKPTAKRATASRRPVIKKRVGAKKRREELEQPDEFMEVGGTVVDWVLANGKMVGGAVGAILVILLVWGLVQKVDRGGREAASADLYQAEKLIPSDMFSARSGPITLPGEEDDEDAKVDEAVAALDEVITEHGRTPQATMARLDAGGALFSSGRFEDALPYFTEAAKAKGVLGTFALSARATTLESLERWDEAETDYRTLRTRSTGATKEQATIDLARVLENKEDFAGARTVYAEFEGEFPESQHLDDVQAKAAAIEGK